MTPQCLLIHGLLFFNNSCECYLCLAAGFPRYETMGWLHMECVMGCAHKGPCALDEEQDMLSDILTFYTRALSTGLEGQSRKFCDI